MNVSIGIGFLANFFEYLNVIVAVVDDDDDDEDETRQTECKKTNKIKLKCV